MRMDGGMDGWMNGWMDVRVFVYVRVCIYVYVFVYPCVSLLVFVHVYTYSMCVCASVCVCLSVFKCHDISTPPRPRQTAGRPILSTRLASSDQISTTRKLLSALPVRCPDFHREISHHVT